MVKQTDAEQVVHIKMEDAKRYIRRLGKAKTDIDARIVFLSRQQGQVSLFHAMYPSQLISNRCSYQRNPPRIR